MRDTLESLKFVQGAISESQSSPELSYFVIRDGYVYGYNGHMQLSSPIEVTTSMAPKARELVRALEQCKDTVEVAMTKTGNLRLISGDFAAVVPTINHTEMTVTVTKRERIVWPGRDFLEVIKVMRPFISDDASRTWSTGVLFNGGYAYATNNIVVARLNTSIDNKVYFNLPLHVINEMIRIDESPNAINIHNNGRNVSIIYSGHRIIDSVLGSTKWPNLKNILNSLKIGVGVPVDTILEAVGKVRHFTDAENSVYIGPDAVFTSTDHKEDGAIVRLPTGFKSVSRYHVDMMRKLSGKGNMVDLNPYPGPAPFWNDDNGLFGALVGVQI